MASFNRVVLMGNITRDPSLRFTPQGTPVGEFGLALNRKRGEQEETCHESLKKRRLVLVEGRLQQDRWESEGQPKSRLVVVGERVHFLSNGNGHGKATAEPESAEAPVGEETPF